MLRLPTGIWYSPGVKANVLFFDKKEGAREAWTDRLVYDLRTNMHFTAEAKPIRRSDSTTSSTAANRAGCTSASRPGAKAKPRGRWRAFACADLLKRDKLA